MIIMKTAGTYYIQQHAMDKTAHESPHMASLLPPRLDVQVPSFAGTSLPGRCQVMIKHQDFGNIPALMGPPCPDQVEDRGLVADSAAERAAGDWTTDDLNTADVIIVGEVRARRGQQRLSGHTRLTLKPLDRH